MNRPGLIRATAALLATVSLPLLAAERRLVAVCEVAIHEERVELEETRLEVELARSRLASFEKIFELIDKLWKADAINRMSYLRGKYDRDAARLDVERAGLLLQRQEALLDYYRTICGSDDDNEGARKADGSLDEIHKRYRRADCDQQAKAVEVAEVNLKFNREWLASVLDLRAANVATIQQVLAAELDVTLEQQRLADALARTAECRAMLDKGANGKGGE